MTIKDTENIKLDPDVYSRCVATAKGYYRMLHRQKEIEEEIIHETHAPDGQPRGGSVGDPTSRKVERIIQRQRENDRRIRAIEQAWMSLHKQHERDLIKKNLFEHIPMMYLDLPMCLRSMKQVRKRFLIQLAKNLHEI